MPLLTPIDTVRPARARVGISLFFFTNGAIFANMLPRYPEIKTAFGLSNTAFGIMVAMFPLAAVLASALPAPLIRRFGAQTVSLVGTIVLAVALGLAGFAPHVALFALALFVGGFTDSIVDAAQNVHGLRVEDAGGRTIINSLHALWSLGATLGGAAGAWAASVGVPLGWHLVTAGAVGVGLAVLATVLGRLPNGGRPEPLEEHHETPRLNRAAWALLLPLAVLAISGTLIEDIAANWAALYLVQIAGVATGTAGLGYVVMIGAQFIGRLLGDPATDKWGRVPVIVSGGVMILVGGLLVVAIPQPAVLMVGYALAGYGCATVVPAAFAAAGRLPGLPEGAGVTMVGWLMRLGFLCTSPLVGAVSDLMNLRVGLAVLPLAGLAVCLLARAARPRTAS